MHDLTKKEDQIKKVTTKKSKGRDSIKIYTIYHLIVYYTGHFFGGSRCSLFTPLPRTRGRSQGRTKVVTCFAKHMELLYTSIYYILWQYHKHICRFVFACCHFLACIWGSGFSKIYPPRWSDIQKHVWLSKCLDVSIVVWPSKGKCFMCLIFQLLVSHQMVLVILFFGGGKHAFHFHKILRTF